MRFGEKIKYICKKESLNLREFAELTGISYNTIRSYTSRGNVPNMKMIYIIAAHSRFEKYKELLLLPNNEESPPIEASEEKPFENELLTLLNDAKEAGVYDEAAEILRVLINRAKR